MNTVDALHIPILWIISAAQEFLPWASSLTGDTYMKKPPPIHNSVKYESPGSKLMQEQLKLNPDDALAGWQVW